VLGLGIMGGRIATRLLDAGVPLAVWNRDPRKAAPLGERGATVAGDPVAAVEGRRVVVLMLADGPAVEEVLWSSGLAEALAPGATVVDMASIAPHEARGHAQRLAARGVAYLDAPVSGGSRGAEQGSLTVMVGGERSAYEAVRGLFEPLGRSTYIGPSGSGQVAKAANQLIVGVTIGAVAEALMLARAAGADAAAVREALLGGFADSRVLREHGQRILSEDFAPGARVSTQLKDLGTIAGLADEVGVTLPLAEAVTALFTSLRDRIGGDLDHSALILELRRRREVSG
jgi:2-hydroxy-3-oxopropionate reductase